MTCRRRPLAAPSLSPRHVMDLVVRAGLNQLLQIRHEHATFAPEPEEGNVVTAKSGAQRPLIRIPHEPHRSRQRYSGLQIPGAIERSDPRRTIGLFHVSLRAVAIRHSRERMTSGGDPSTVYGAGARSWAKGDPRTPQTSPWALTLSWARRIHSVG